MTGRVEIGAVVKDVRSFVEGVGLPRIIVGGSVVALSLYATSRLLRKTYTLPPGPRPWPIIGNLPSLMQTKDFTKYFDDLHEKYGDIYTMYMGPAPFVVLCGIDLVREAFITKGTDFGGRPRSFSTDLMSRGGKDIAMGQLGPVWQVQRKIMHGAIRKFASGTQLEKFLQEVVDNFASQLTKDIEEKGAVFDVTTNINMMIYNLSYNLVFGTVDEGDNAEFLKLSEMLDDINEKMSDGIAADYFPIMQYVPTPTLRKLKAAMKDVQDFIETRWIQHNKTYEPGNASDFTYHLIELRRELESSGEDTSALSQLTEEHLLELISDFFFGATDTTRYTMTWVILYMAAHQDVQHKMQQEIDKAVGNREVRLSDRPNLPYTEAVLHEVMRIRPLTVFFIHETTCETTIGGYTLPANTGIMASLRSLHYDPKIFPDPDKFLPDRFLNEDGTFLPRPGGWMPFSTGRRVCVGEALAKSQLHMLTAMIFQRFSIEPEEGQTVDLDHKGLALFLMPKGCKVKVVSRM